MNGFGFIEYKDAMDARDVVPGTAVISTYANPRLTLFNSLSRLRLHG